MLEKGCLTGIKVIDISRLLPGPFCSSILADHGARVIAIEDKRYEADGHYVSTLYRNKEHMTLDLKSEKGKEIFFQLVKDADVVLEGFRPGVVKRLGVDYEKVKNVNNKIIYCSITGFGQTGKFRDRAGHDVNYLSLSGILDLIGEPSKPPSIPGVQFADIAGAMNGAIGILLAIIARGKSGKGQYIDISLTDSMIGFHAVNLFMYQLLNDIPKRGDSFLSHHYSFYNTYETSDNKYISIGALEHRFWKCLCEFFNVNEYIPFQFDEEKRVEIIDFFRKQFKTKTLAQWEEELSKIDVCSAKIQNLKEMLDDPFFIEREMVVDLKDENGNIIKALGIPAKLSETPGKIHTKPVKFGENTNDILKEMGFSDESISDLRTKNII